VVLPALVLYSLSPFTRFDDNFLSEKGDDKESKPENKLRGQETNQALRGWAVLPKKIKK
jgi:hypothetical protein